MNMERPKAIDGYCCEGGIWKGLHDAGIDAYGIDTFEEFSRNRYPGAVYVGDFFLAMVRLLSGEELPFVHRGGRVEWLGLKDFIYVHTSPPCQHASAGTRSLRQDGKAYPKLVEPTRWLLEQTGLPWVIENVKGAALRNPILLCGSMFGMGAEDEDGLPLRLERHRLFETNWPLMAPGPCDHDPAIWVAGVYGGGRARKPGQTAAEHRHACKHIRKGGYVPRSTKVQQALLGIDWMTKRGMAQAIPPRYGEFIGEQLLAHLRTLGAAA